MGRKEYTTRILLEWLPTYIYNTVQVKTITKFN